MRNQLQHERIAGLLAEIEREKGPIDPLVMAEVRCEWADTRKRSGDTRRALVGKQNRSGLT